MPADRLCSRLREEYRFAGCEPFEQIDKAVAAACDAARPSDVICACGSLYLIGYARSEFLKITMQEKSDQAGRSKSG